MHNLKNYYERNIYLLFNKKGLYDLHTVQNIKNNIFT